MVSQLCLLCGSTLNCQTLCLGARPQYKLVVDEDVKKPTNQLTKCQRKRVLFTYRSKMCNSSQLTLISVLRPYDPAKLTLTVKYSFHSKVCGLQNGRSLIQKLYCVCNTTFQIYIVKREKLNL